MNKKTKKDLNIEVSVRRYFVNKRVNFAGSPGANSSSESSYGNSGNSSS